VCVKQETLAHWKRDDQEGQHQRRRRLRRRPRWRPRWRRRPLLEAIFFLLPRARRRRRRCTDVGSSVDNFGGGRRRLHPPPAASAYVYTSARIPSVRRSSVAIDASTDAFCLFLYALSTCLQVKPFFSERFFARTQNLRNEMTYFFAQIFKEK